MPVASLVFFVSVMQVHVQFLVDDDSDDSYSEETENCDEWSKVERPLISEKHHNRPKLRLPIVS